MPDDFDLPIFRSASNVRISNPATAAAAISGFRPTTSSLPVFVDVGSRKIESQIERDGVPIGVLPVDAAILAEAILVRPILQVKVVSQSVAPGTPVPSAPPSTWSWHRPATSRSASSPACTTSSRRSRSPMPTRPWSAPTPW